MLILRQREFVKKKKQNRKLLRAAENEVMHANRAAKKVLKAQKALERGNINEAEQLTKSAEKAFQSARMDGGRLEQMATKISKTRPSALSDEGLRISEGGVKEAKVLVNPNTKTVHARAVFGRNSGLIHQPDNNMTTVSFKSKKASVAPNSKPTTVVPKKASVSNSKPVVKTESKLSRLAKNKYAQAGAGLLALGGIGYGVHRHIKNKNKGE